MTDEQLDTLAFVFLDEIKEWKRVKFPDGCVAVRAGTFETVKCDDEFEAEAMIKRRAASAMLKFYHSEQANG